MQTSWNRVSLWSFGRMESRQHGRRREKVQLCLLYPADVTLQQSRDTTLRSRERLGAPGHDSERSRRKKWHSDLPPTMAPPTCSRPNSSPSSTSPPTPPPRAPT